MKIQPPNYTQTPNTIFDLLPQMKEAEMRVVLTIVRETFGWHKEKAKLSVSRLMRLSGLSKQGVLNGIEAGIERGVITKLPDGDSFTYQLGVNEVDPPLVNEVDTLGVNEVDTYKERNINKPLEVKKTTTTNQPAVSKLDARGEPSQNGLVGSPPEQPTAVFLIDKEPAQPEQPTATTVSSVTLIWQKM